jgi:hypothetical protein
MEEKKTERGFNCGKFLDDNGVECSIQKSSSAMEDKIWLGIAKADPIILSSKIIENGVGWAKYPIPEDVFIGTRMHLSIEQVKQLLPMLNKFVETGDII